MKKTLLMLGLFLLPALAMAAPAFSGSWVRDNAKSDPAPYPLYWLTRPVAATGGGRNGRTLMRVNQDGNKLQVIDTQQPLRDYMLDGKPHTVITDTGVEKAAVTANLQGDNLVIETTKPYGGMPGNITLKETEVWSLSPDGKTLTIAITEDIPARQKTIKEVFDRTETEGDALCSAGCVVLH